MLEIIVTEEFEKQYQELPPTIQKKAERKEKIFRKDPFHSTLCTEKLEPKNKQVWSFRIDKKYRILFRFIKQNKILFLICGHHNWVYRYKF